MTLLTESVLAGEWIVVDGISSTYLGTVKIKVGELERPAFIEGTQAMIRCPKLEAGNYPVRVDGKRIGDVKVNK